jgi:plasmid maintenance system antidote protein VapI
VSGAASPPTAAGRYFDTTPKFWLNLQSSYDLAVAAEAKAVEIERTVNPRAAA